MSLHYDWNWEISCNDIHLGLIKTQNKSQPIITCISMKLSMKPSMKPRSEKDELSSMPLFNWDDVMIPLIELAVRFNGKTLPKQVVPPLPAKTARKVMRMLTVSGTGCKSPVVDGNAFLTLLCSEASLVSLEK